jgi:transcriptional regulator with XRE-family HTH domain
MSVGARFLGAPSRQDFVVAPTETAAWIHLEPEQIGADLREQTGEAHWHDGNRMEIESYLDTIATRLRAWRSEQGLTLQQVASRSGVAASTIQKVESKQMVPTIAVLFKITRGLGRGPAELIEDPTSSPDVVYRPAEELADAGGPAVALTGRLENARLSSWRVVQRPGGGVQVPDLGRDSEVLILCERGQLDAIVGERTYTLRPGDSLHCKTRDGLCWRVTGEEAAGFTVIGTDAAALDRLLVLSVL